MTSFLQCFKKNFRQKIMFRKVRYISFKYRVNKLPKCLLINKWVFRMPAKNAIMAWICQLRFLFMLIEQLNDWNIILELFYFKKYNISFLLKHNIKIHLTYFSWFRLTIFRQKILLFLLNFNKNWFKIWIYIKKI